MTDEPKYTPLLPWDRLAAMQAALCKCIFDDAKLDPAMATEIFEALQAVATSQQRELRAGLGPPVAEDTWRAAATALFLVEHRNVKPKVAVWAAWISMPDSRPTGQAAVEKAFHKLRAGTATALVLPEMRTPTLQGIRAAMARLAKHDRLDVSEDID